MIAKRTPPRTKRTPVELQDAPFVHVDGIYPLVAFEKVSGMGKAAMKTARRNGLRVRKVLGRSYVLGRDFLNWIDERTREPSPPAG